MMLLSKTDTTLLKGIAIMLMVYLHLFNSMDNVQLCHTFLSVNDEPVVYALSRAAGPVPFFLILSGYGLACKYDTKGITLNGQLKSLLKLFVFYWITLLVFVPIGFFINAEKYPGTLLDFFLNALSWSHSYNGEAWFLFPYALISLLSRYIIFFIKRFRVYIPLFIIGFAGIVYSHLLVSVMGVTILNESLMAFNSYQFVNLLFAFSLGVVAKDKRWLVKYGIDCPYKNLLLILLLILLVTIRVYLPIPINWNPVYALLFMILVINIDLGVHTRNTLVKLGIMSMPIWFIHSWFFKYLFHDFYYSLTYPVIIYITVLVTSYVVSVVLMRASKCVYLRLNI